MQFLLEQRCAIRGTSLTVFFNHIYKWADFGSEFTSLAYHFANWSLTPKKIIFYSCFFL